MLALSKRPYRVGRTVSKEGLRDCKLVLTQNPEDGKKALQARVQADCDSLWNRYAGARINRIRDAVGDGHLVA